MVVIWMGWRLIRSSRLNGALGMWSGTCCDEYSRVICQDYKVWSTYNKPGQVLRPGRSSIASDLPANTSVS